MANDRRCPIHGDAPICGCRPPTAAKPQEWDGEGLCPSCDVSAGGPCTCLAAFGDSRDLEWEVTHKKSKVHKGRGSTPEAALRDLRDGFALGVQAAQEEIAREQKRLDKLTALLGETDVAPGSNSVLEPAASGEASGEGNEPDPGAA